MRGITTAMMMLGLPAACSDETLTGYGNVDATYVLQEVDGAAFTARATLILDTPGRIRGSGPCNSYSATQDAPCPWFETGPMQVTKRACPDLAEEAIFLRALSEMRFAEAQGSVLILSTETGREMVFRASNAP